MTRQFSFAFVVTALLLASAPVRAQEAQEEQAPPQPAAAPHIFSVQGAKCPPASRPYEGPENDVAMKQGWIYCVFSRTAMRIARSEYDGQCPPDMKLAKEDGDYLWCMLPEDMRFGVKHAVGFGIPMPTDETLPPEEAAPPKEVPSPHEASPAEHAPAPKPALMNRFRAWLTGLFR